MCMRWRSTVLNIFLSLFGNVLFPFSHWTRWQLINSSHRSRPFENRTRVDYRVKRIVVEGNEIFNFNFKFPTPEVRATNIIIEGSNSRNHRHFGSYFYSAITRLKPSKLRKPVINLRSSLYLFHSVVVSFLQRAVHVAKTRYRVSLKQRKETRFSRVARA